MIGLVYISKSNRSFTDLEIEQLAEAAAWNNKLHDLTGYLYMEGDYFLQYLEGRKSKVEQLFQNICSDARHKVLRSAQQDNLQKHRFLSWHMKYLSKKELRPINMEKIMIDYMMVFLAEGEEPQEKEQYRIWRMVDLISQSQWKMA